MVEILKSQFHCSISRREFVIQLNRSSDYSCLQSLSQTRSHSATGEDEISFDDNQFTVMNQEGFWFLGDT